MSAFRTPLMSWRGGRLLFMHRNGGPSIGQASRRGASSSPSVYPQASREKKQKMTAAEAFGAQTFDVDRYLANRPRYPPHLYDEIEKFHFGPDATKAQAEQQDNTGSGTLLDLGCGPGFAAFPLFAHPQMGRLIGIDTGPGMVGVAPKALKSWIATTGQNHLEQKRADFSVGSANDLSSIVQQDQSVDLAIAATAAHWFDYQPLWRELSRVIKPGGSVIFWTYGENYLPAHPDLQPDTFRFMQSSDESDASSIGPYFPQPGRSYLCNLLRNVPFPHELPRFYPGNVALEEDLLSQWDISTATRKMHPLAGDGVTDLSWARELQSKQATQDPQSRQWPLETTGPFRLEQIMTWKGYESYIRTASALLAYFKAHPEHKEGEGDVADVYVKHLKNKVLEQRSKGIGTQEGLDDEHIRVAWPLGLMAIKKLPAENSTRAADQQGGHARDQQSKASSPRTQASRGFCTSVRATRSLEQDLGRSRNASRSKQAPTRHQSTLASPAPKPSDSANSATGHVKASDASSTAASKKPFTLAPYLALSRIDKPIGSWLLYWPCAWSLTLAGHACQVAAPVLLFDLFIFAVGAFVMRGAGCTINDMWDSRMDRMVERTKSRPLAARDVTYFQAWSFLGLQLSAGLAVLLQLNWYSVVLGAASLGVVIIYPLMKRITYWPQLVLGLAFNWGALLGWAALSHPPAWQATLPLYAGSICWTLVYDTIYAHQDKTDDVSAGVKSTALLFGDRWTKPVLTGFSLGFVSLLVNSVAASTGGLASLLPTASATAATAGSTWLNLVTTGHPFFLASLVPVCAHLAWQIRTVDLNSRAECWKKFVSNQYLGLIIWAGLFLDYAVQVWWALAP